MFERTFVNEYFRNPFLWWGLFMFSFMIFSAALPLVFAMQTIVTYQMYILILFSSLTIAFLLAVVPIRRSLRKLFEKKETKTYAILSLILIVLIFLTEAAYFLSDPPIIFSELYPPIVSDRNLLDYVINIKTIAEFIALPLLYAYIFTIIKVKLKKEGYEIHDRFKNNLKYISYVVIVNFGMYGLAMFLTSTPV